MMTTKEALDLITSRWQADQKVYWVNDKMDREALIQAFRLVFEQNAQTYISKIRTDYEDNLTLIG